MKESYLYDLLRRSAGARRKKGPRVLTPEVLADALAAAKGLDDPRKAALVQLQLLSEHARCHADLSLDALAPIDAIQKDLLRDDARDKSSGAPRVFNGNVLAACLAVHWLRQAGHSLSAACAEIAPHWGKSPNQILNARKDFLGYKTGTPKMHEVYNSQIAIECTARQAEQWARAAISRIERVE